MGGYSANKTRRILGSVPAKRKSSDPCDLEFCIDLVGVRSSVSQNLGLGEMLEVVLIVRGSVRSVVCQIAAGEIVGTLAAFRGLAQLISCLEGGRSYIAQVEAASATRCSVRVVRIS